MMSQSRDYGLEVGQTWGIAVAICYRLPQQEVDELFFRQQEKTSHSNALVFTGYFNYPDICNSANVESNDAKFLTSNP